MVWFILRRVMLLYHFIWGIVNSLFKKTDHSSKQYYTRYYLIRMRVYHTTIVNILGNTVKKIFGKRLTQDLVATILVMPMACDTNLFAYFFYLKVFVKEMWYLHSTGRSDNFSTYPDTIIGWSGLLTYEDNLRAYKLSANLKFK